MKIEGDVNKTYILLSGLDISADISLTENVKLLPADTSHLDFNTAVSTCSHPEDIAVVAAFIPRITAQFEINAPTAKDLATHAWNSSWDALLLSAILHKEISFNLQSDTEANSISAETSLRATNHHFRGLTQASPHKLTDNDVTWVTTYFSDARLLLPNHCINFFNL